jgi:hypothetical protein
VSFPKFIVIDGKRIAWRDLLKLRREQREAAQIAQPVLFELKDDTRPKSQQTAASRYCSPWWQLTDATMLDFRVDWEEQ